MNPGLSVTEQARSTAVRRGSARPAVPSGGARCVRGGRARTASAAGGGAASSGGAGSRRPGGSTVGRTSPGFGAACRPAPPLELTRGCCSRAGVRRRAAPSESVADRRSDGRGPGFGGAQFSSRSGDGRGPGSRGMRRCPMARGSSWCSPCRSESSTSRRPAPFDGARWLVAGAGHSEDDVPEASGAGGSAAGRVVGSELAEPTEQGVAERGLGRAGFARVQARRARGRCGSGWSGWAVYDRVSYGGEPADRGRSRSACSGRRSGSSARRPGRRRGGVPRAGRRRRSRPPPTSGHRALGLVGRSPRPAGPASRQCLDHPHRRCDAGRRPRSTASRDPPPARRPGSRRPRTARLRRSRSSGSSTGEATYGQPEPVSVTSGGI